MFKPEVFRKQMYCVEEKRVTLLGLFGAPTIIRRPQSDPAPVELHPP